MTVENTRGADAPRNDACAAGLQAKKDDMTADAVNMLAGSARQVTAAIRTAGEKTGVDFEILYNMAKRESALDPMARARTSSAAGLFQFIEQTWLATVKKHGAKHGLAQAANGITQDGAGRLSVADPAARKAILDLRFDPEKAAALAGELIRDNKAGLEARLGRAANGAEIYAAHFLGLGGAAKLLTASPDAEAATLLPRAAAANRPVFYDGARPRTVAEVMASIERSMGVSAQSDGSENAPETKSLASAATGVAAQLTDVWTQHPAATRVAGAAALETPRMLTTGVNSVLPSLSPLALVILQAFDPTELGGFRNAQQNRR